MFGQKNISISILNRKERLLDKEKLFFQINDRSHFVAERELNESSFSSEILMGPLTQEPLKYIRANKNMEDFI